MHQVYQTDNGVGGPAHAPGQYGNQRYLRNAHQPQAAFGGGMPQNNTLQPPPQMAPRQGQYWGQGGGTPAPPLPQQQQQQQRSSGPPSQGSRVQILGTPQFEEKDTLHGKLLILKQLVEPTFVLFHTDSCGVCQQVVPLYVQLAHSLQYRFAMCNLTHHPQVLSMSESTVSPITHVPRLYLYAKGWPFMVYKDSWQPQKLEQFMGVAWKKATEGAASKQPQQSNNYNNNRPNNQMQQAQQQFNPQHPPPPNLPRNQGRVSTVEYPPSDPATGAVPSQYASIGSAPASTVTCEGDECGDLISFNEVLCQGSHGCYVMSDIPPN